MNELVHTFHCRRAGFLCYMRGTFHDHLFFFSRAKTTEIKSGGISMVYILRNVPEDSQQPSKKKNIMGKMVPITLQTPGSQK